MHLVSAPPAHDRRREVLGHASHRVAHLHGRDATRLVGTAKTAGSPCGRRNRACRSASHEGTSERQDFSLLISTHLLGHDGGVGVLDDGRQGAVVVEEHHDLLPLRRGQHRLEPGQCRRVLLLRAHRRQAVRQATGAGTAWHMEGDGR
jgi:hypothetical protein